MSEESNQNYGATGFERWFYMIVDKMNLAISKIIDFVGARPWEKWILVGRNFTERFTAPFIVLVSLTSIFATIAVALKYDMRISHVFSMLLIPLACMPLSVHLLPKMTSLITSLVEKNEVQYIRPQILHIGKIGGLILFVYATVALAEFRLSGFIASVIMVILSLIVIVVCCNPQIVSVKAGYPKNSAEEIITLLLFPLKVFISLFTFILGLVVLWGLVVGVSCVFQNGYAVFQGLFYFNASILAPILLPLTVYVLYLYVNFIFDLVSTAVCLPRKLEEIRDAVKEKKD